MSLDERLKEARKNAGLSQKEVSERTGIAKSTLSEYESGKTTPTMNALYKIMNVIGVSADFLFQDDVENHETILTEKESELIGYSRRLSENNQEKLLKYAIGLLYTQDDERILERAAQTEESQGTA